MRQLELLAPARDANIGIAAIDCGADAVYIAGPQFGARQAAANDIEEIKRLCDYAHKFGVHIFVTLNTILYDSELEAAYKQMLAVQDAGADAIIVQDLAIIRMAECGLGNIKSDLHIPLHASTQCAIRTPEHAAFLESLGFSRLILERELSLEQIRAIRNAVSCELEFFVHGALCVCYSGQCYLSEMISERSANRGACIQACRSLYDLTDASGKVLLKDKALLSLKDFNLRNRLEELADAGITSFKIEGRLKNESYVRNVVRDYAIGLDQVVEKNSQKYIRASFGKIIGGFTPDTRKTFNRGYTELYIDGQRGKWASMDAAKSMGEEIGTVQSVGKDHVTLNLANPAISLNNGDGFSFVAKDSSIYGFRGDVCKGNRILCKNTSGLYAGAKLFRNINTAFEKEIDRNRCIREIQAGVALDFHKSDGIWSITASCTTEDGRNLVSRYDAGDQDAANIDRMKAIIDGQISKSTGNYRFHVSEMTCPEGMPFISASAVNAIRRDLAAGLESVPCIKRDLLKSNINTTRKSDNAQKEISYKSNVSNRLSASVYEDAGAAVNEQAYELTHKSNAELMRSRYCIRYELDMCPKHNNVKDCGKLFLINNGNRLALHFDCRNCEMIVLESSPNTPQRPK